MYMTITQNDNAYISYVFNASLSWPCLNRINYQFLQRIVRSCLHVFSSQSQSGQTSLNQGNRDHQTVSCLVLTNNILVFCPSCALLQADLQRPERNKTIKHLVAVADHCWKAWPWHKAQVQRRSFGPKHFTKFGLPTHPPHPQTEDADFRYATFVQPP